MENRSELSSRIAVALIVLGAVSRLVPHPWNASPLTALALFGAVHLGRRSSLLVPLAAIAISDVFLGLHRTMPFTWGGIALVAGLGWRLGDRPGAARLALASVSGSVVFFLLSNFGVWWTEGMYPMTAAGFRDCYIAALPFFRGTLIGDLAYTGAIFGAWEGLRRLQVMESPVAR